MRRFAAGRTSVRVTIDTNCLIDLEVPSTRQRRLIELLKRWRDGELSLCVPAISASERTQDNQYLKSYSQFVERLERVGLGDAEQLYPMAYFDICFWDRCLISGPELEELERRIHDVLHPTISYDYGLFCAEQGIDRSVAPVDSRWRNAKCDVQVMWSHIWHRADVLVTNDRNFVKDSKLPKLIALGAKRILLPDDLSMLYPDL